VLADNPPTNIFFVLVTIWKRGRREDMRLGLCESTSEDFKRTEDKEEKRELGDDRLWVLCPTGRLKRRYCVICRVVRVCLGNG